MAEHVDLDIDIAYFCDGDCTAIRHAKNCINLLGFLSDLFLRTMKNYECKNSRYVHFLMPRFCRNLRSWHEMRFRLSFCKI